MVEFWEYLWGTLPQPTFAEDEKLKVQFKRPFFNKY